jgi:hypothetical protein
MSTCAMNQMIVWLHRCAKQWLELDTPVQTRGGYTQYQITVSPSMIVLIRPFTCVIQWWMGGQDVESTHSGSKTSFQQLHLQQQMIFGPGQGDMDIYFLYTPSVHWRALSALTCFTAITIAHLTSSLGHHEAITVNKGTSCAQSKGLLQSPHTYTYG